MKPTISILDKRFVYRNSVNTEIRDRFAKVRAQQAIDAAASNAEAAQGLRKVAQLPMRAKVGKS